MSGFRSLGQRRRRRTMRLPDTGEAGMLFIPDQEVTLATFGDAAHVALEMISAAVIVHEGLLMLDERRRLVGALCDAPGEVGLLVGQLRLPDVDDFCQVIDIVVRDEVIEGPADPDDRRKFLALRKHMALQGLLLLDVILCDADRLRSLAIGCDPDPIWFEPFEPLPHT